MQFQMVSGGQKVIWFSQIISKVCEIAGSLQGNRPITQKTPDQQAFKRKMQLILSDDLPAGL